jgi:WD40 repeat protein/serine/threonine protein kinase
MADDFWLPDAADAVAEESSRRYSVTCRCGNQMRVKPKHFGRMCRCTKCHFPIYVTYDNVQPPVGPGDRSVPRVFKENEVPVHWRKGDLLMELYEVRDTLGEGGMGVVYQVYHRGWGRTLAVKSPSPKLLGDAEWLSQFEHECETWISLPPHPNVVECYYVRRLGGIPRVFVEYLKGRDLGHLIDSKALYAGGEIAALKRMLDVAIQFCWGLHHAHRHGVIHQDVKPGNLIIAEGDLCKVTDFGLAMVWAMEHTPPGSAGSDRDSAGDRGEFKGLTGGTPTYRSPDQRHYGEVTYKTDIWSWGVSMIEMFSGDVYWRQGHKAKNVLDDLLKYGSRYEMVPKMPEKMQALLYECFQENPDDRPVGMNVIADRLRETYKDVTGKAYPRDEPKLADMTLEVLNNRAVSMIDLGKFAEAEQLWAEVLAARPGHIEAEYNRHLYYWKAGLITDAQMVEVLYAITDAHKKEWFPAYLLARVMIQRGDAGVALKLLEGIKQTVENRREVNYGLAMAQNYVARDRKLIWDFNPGTIKVSAVALSFDGWRALTGGVDGHIRNWEVISRQCTAVLNGHTDRVHSLCLRDDEQYALSASADHTLRLWDPMSGKCVRTFEGHRAAVRSVMFSPDGVMAISGSDDGSLMLWDLGSSERVRLFTGHEANVNQVLFARDGNFAYSASSDGTVKRWEVETGRCMHTFGVSDGRVPSLALSQDGETLLTCSDVWLHVWDVKSGDLIREIRGHTKEILSVCLSESGRYALSATGMGTMKVWEISTGQCLKSLQGHAPISLSRDGQYAISCGAHGEFKLWSVHIGDPPFPAQYVLCKGSTT